MNGANDLWPVSIKAVLIVDGCVLLVENDRDEWELPGGRLERGETPSACVVREIAEETSIHAICGDLLLTETFEVVPGKHVLIVAFACGAPAGSNVVISDEHRSFAWFALDELPTARLPEIYRRAVRLARERAKPAAISSAISPRRADEL